jgi:hypothetical protein
MRYFFAAAMTIVLLMGPAYSQLGLGPEKTPLDLKYEREDRERAENERAYNETMKRLKKQPPAKVGSEPWKTVRPASDADSKR